MAILSRIDRRAGRPARLALLLLALLVLAGCGPQLITGRPPFVGISSMNLDGDSLTTQFRIANQNDVAMNLLQVDISVTVDSIELVRDQRSVTMDIDANSAEDLGATLPASPAARERLEALQRGEVLSLPFALSGRVRSQEDGSLRFEQKGHLYPVPGRPGQFRAAVTQAEELRREEEL